MVVNGFIELLYIGLRENEGRRRVLPNHCEFETLIRACPCSCTVSQVNEEEMD